MRKQKTIDETRASLQHQFAIEDVRTAEKEIDMAGGVDEWLIRKGACKRDATGTLTVIAYTDAFGDVTDIPYTKLSALADEAIRLKGRRSFAKKKEMEHLAKVADIDDAIPM